MPGTQSGVSWSVQLPPEPLQGLLRGRLAATLTIVPEEDPLPADHALSGWLRAQGGRIGSPLHLPLAGTQIAGFLHALTDHPRVACGPKRLPFEVSGHARLALREATCDGRDVRLVPDPEGAEGEMLALGTDWWLVAHQSCRRLGPGTPPPALADALADVSKGKPATVPVATFLAHLDSWNQWFDFPADSWPETLHYLPARFIVALYLEGSLDHLQARLEITYPGAAVVAPGQGETPGLPRLGAGSRMCELRDTEGEHAAAASLARAGFRPTDPALGRWELRGESAVLEFVTRILPPLQQSWQVHEAKHLQLARRQVAVVEPKIEILGSGDTWTDLKLSFETDDGQLVSAAEVQRMLRSGGMGRAVAGRRKLVVGGEVADVLEPLLGELDLRQEGGCYKATAMAAEVLQEIAKTRGNPGARQRLVPEADFQPAGGLRAELRPYQAAGVQWMGERVRRFGGALLADDMGLGKTIQTIALIEHLFETTDRSEWKPVLVVVTTSLLWNWAGEFGRFAPGRVVRVLHGVGREVERGRVGVGEVVLTSYGTLARDLAWHLGREYGGVVVDEASLMRNPDTDHARALCKLRAGWRVALTGTPVENGVRDLWSIFRFLFPGWLGGREEFRERYELPLAGGEGDVGVMRRLRLRTGPFVLRRTKDQVAADLPAKLLIDERCAMSAEQEGVYRRLLEEGRKRVEGLWEAGQGGAARMQVLTLLLRLRQACCDLGLLGDERLAGLPVARRSGKLERLLELLGGALAGGHKVLVFSQFRSQLGQIGRSCDERGWRWLQLDGQTRDRQQVVDAFQAPDGPPIFLISLKAGGYGLNLTAADTVVHFDPWWNPAAEAQATDRAHRLGQARPVTVYRLLTSGTVEEKVLRMQARKRALAAAVDESGSGDGGGWTDGELRALLDGLG